MKVLPFLHRYISGFAKAPVLLVLGIFLVPMPSRSGATFFVTDQRGGRSERVVLRNGTTFEIDGRTYFDDIAKEEKRNTPRRTPSHHQERAAGDSQGSRRD